MIKPITIAAMMLLLFAAAPLLADDQRDASLDRRTNNIRAILNISDVEKAKAARKAVGEYYDAGTKSDDALLNVLSAQASPAKVRQEKPYIEMLLALPLTGSEAGLPAAETGYTADITKRADRIVATLGISETAKSDTVHELIMNQYRALRDNDLVRDSKLKAAGASADAVKAQTLESRKILHDAYLTNLSALLTPEQVEKVKDGQHTNKVNFTFTGYKNEYPGMNEEQQAKVLAFLKEARELAMDGGDSKEKDAIFNKYKGKINNYLASEKVPSKKASAAPKTATQPTN